LTVNKTEIKKMRRSFMVCSFDKQHFVSFSENATSGILPLCENLNMSYLCAMLFL